MATIFYIGCFIIAFLFYIWLYVTDVKKSVCQHIMVLIMVISNLGFLGSSVAQNIREAELAYKIVYLGGCFLPMLFFYTVCEICHFSLKKWVIMLLASIQIVIYGFILSIGFSDIYYKNAELIIENGSSYITKEYGPTHFLYPLTLYIYVIASMTVAVLAIYKKKAVNRREIAHMISLTLVASAIYMIRMIFHIRLDIMALGYGVTMLGTLVPMYHSNLYTTEKNTDIINEQLGQIGFISFNKKMEYMGCNDFAASIFPEIKDSLIGQKLQTEDEALLEIMDSLKAHKDELEGKHHHKHSHIKGETLKIKDRFFDYEIHTVEDFRKACKGYFIELRDETEHYRMMELTERYNEELSNEVEQKTETIREIQEKTILGMAQMVESRDLSTGGHIKRTSDVVKIFSEKLMEADMGFDAHFLNLVARSAPMHDIGKIGVDDAVLRKRGRFTDEEYDMMKKHAEIGGKMVLDILTGVEEEEFVRVAHNVANYHHEKVNGKGYPEGLLGDDIPLEARIMALADVFDALVSKRCYKEAFSYDEAFSIIEKDAGSHFDAALAAVFLECRPSLEYYYDHCDVS